MADEYVDATASQTDPSAVDPSATSQPGAQPETPAEPQVPFHQHPRWQELMRERATLRESNSQLQAQLQQVQQKIQQMDQARQQPGQPPTKEYIDAAEALLKIMEANPRLKTLLGLADAAPQLISGYQGVQSLTQAQTQSLLRSGRQEVESLASKANLPTDDESVSLLEEMVAGVIKRTPGAEERFRQGDLSTVTEAFKKIQDGFVATLRRPAAASVVDTKTKVGKLPPAPRGAGLPGGAAPPKLEPGKERAFEQSLHQRAAEMLSNLTG